MRSEEGLGRAVANGGHFLSIVTIGPELELEDNTEQTICVTCLGLQRTLPARKMCKKLWNPSS